MGFLNDLIRDLSLQPLHEALDKILSFTTTLVRCDSCFIYVLEGDELVLRASKNSRPEIVDRLKLKLGEGITGWVAEHQKPVAVGVKASDDPRFKIFSDLPEDRFEAFLSVPVMTHGRVVGVINLQNRSPHRYNSREIKLVSSIGALAGAEIEMARLEGQSAQDLTARRQAEDRFYKAFNANPEPITIATISDESFLDVNDSFLRVTGYLREEVIGRNVRDLDFWVRPEDRDQFLETLASRGSVRDLEIVFRTKSGQSRTGLNSAELIELAGQPCVIAILKDITERKLLEQQLRQSQKMEAVGRLSAGVAHDFNNLLSVIIGYSEDLEERLDPSSPLLRNAAQIKKAADRAAALTRQLLAFSRQQILKPEVLNLNAVIEDLKKMLPRMLGPDVELRSVLDPELFAVKADPGQIEQVIINLAVNARDAMPEGGTLLLETHNENVDAASASAPYIDMAPGPYASLVVTDTGTGMEPSVLAQIFEPFFTTKEQGKGTGLGLATVYGVVKQSGGYIWAESAVGLGTTFRVYLPRASEVPRNAEKEADVPALARGSETILLVDDEDDLRAMVGAILENAGYTVLQANGGAGALEIARLHRGPIHVLLTDVLMPGMNGRVVAKALLQIRPSLQVIYTSGYADFTPGGSKDILENFLAKPFTRDALLRKLDEALHAARPTDA